MRRDLAELASREHDLVVVGGGIFGVCAAWDATLRGLDVALLERDDFAHAASAHCFKMIHGGIRYLQHADLPRVRQSARERRILLRVAPHLCRPLPILVPTYGHGTRGKELLAAGMKVYDWLTFDRNRGIDDPACRIPPARFLSRGEALARFPGLERPDLTGGAIFHDGQMYSPARLALAFLRAAVDRGARAANRAEVTGLLRRGDRVHGVVVRDRDDGSEHEVRGRMVLCAGGGWSDGLLAASLGRSLEPRPTFSRDAYFVVRRELSSELALAVSGSTRDPDAILSRSARHLFLVPWRGCTLVGVWHRVWDASAPRDPRVEDEELERWIGEVNGACPELRVRPDDVALVHCGLVLFGENRPGASDLSYGKRSRLVDHARDHGVQGLLTLLGVRYTTARGDAARAVDLACARLGAASSRCRTADTPVHGGDVASVGGVEALEREALARRPAPASEAAVRALVRNHGTAFERVLALGRVEPELLAPLPGSDTLGAEVAYAVREEMARTLEDVVFRRTDLGTTGFPGDAALDGAADVAAAELGWDEERRKREREAVLCRFPQRAAR